MALVSIKGRYYYTQSVRVGDWVTSTCLAKGELALFIAALKEEERQQRIADRLERSELEQARKAAQREERRLAGQEFQDWKARLDSADRLMTVFYRDISKTVETYLSHLGFHRHARGEWRRRRTTTMNRDIDRYGGMAVLTANERLAERAWKGDPAALESVLLEAQRHHHESVEAALLSYLPLGSGPPYQDVTEFLAVKLASMRHELAPPGSSPAEKLLAERASLCWLHQELLEYEAARLFASNAIDSRRAEILDRRLQRVQSRFAHALTALARVRRLNVPNVQVNIAENQVVDNR